MVRQSGMAVAGGWCLGGETQATTRSCRIDPSTAEIRRRSQSEAPRPGSRSVPARSAGREQRRRNRDAHEPAEPANRSQRSRSVLAQQAIAIVGERAWVTVAARTIPAGGWRRAAARTTGSQVRHRQPGSGSGVYPAVGAALVRDVRRAPQLPRQGRPAGAPAACPRSPSRCRRARPMARPTASRSVAAFVSRHRRTSRSPPRPQGHDRANPQPADEEPRGRQAR